MAFWQVCPQQSNDCPIQAIAENLQLLRQMRGDICVKQTGFIFPIRGVEFSWGNGL
jgi:hypothetical protein